MFGAYARLHELQKSSAWVTDGVLRKGRHKEKIINAAEKKDSEK